MAELLEEYAKRDSAEWEMEEKCPSGCGGILRGMHVKGLLCLWSKTPEDEE